MNDDHKLASVPDVTPGCDCDTCRAVLMLREHLTRTMKMVCDECNMEPDEFRGMLVHIAAGELVAGGAHSLIAIEVAIAGIKEQAQRLHASKGTRH